jgi:hypothetical protein
MDESYPLLRRNRRVPLARRDEVPAGEHLHTGEIGTGDREEFDQWGELVGDQKIDGTPGGLGDGTADR